MYKGGHTTYIVLKTPYTLMRKQHIVITGENERLARGKRSFENILLQIEFFL